jgi:AraC family transcriptional regulator of adaptative response/methylated-DNA-[protein]-cysteine methyltransferase
MEGKMVALAESQKLSQEPVAAENQEEIYWQAVLERDQSRDGTFFYGVRSTGIYCRPSCPSRRPGRDQVVFFRQPAQAEQAGFRPCRRCRPLEAANYQAELVQQACRYIEENITRPEGPPALAELGQQVGLSPFHLQRLFKRLTGVSPRQYAEAYRLGQLKTRLKDQENVTGALYSAGYGSSSRLYERASESMGMTPASYRRGGPGTAIHYTVVDCSLGRLLVAATEKGVCAVRLGEDDAKLKAELAHEYPAAELYQDESSALNEWVKEILNYLAGQQPKLDLPLDIQATAFQRQVWEALRTIPYGSTRSYGEVAVALGQPKAVRAVAHACAVNPVALVIPCHRVVRQDGSLAGYRWGLDRKRALLDKERAVASGE